MDVWDRLRFQGDIIQIREGSQGGKESQEGGPGETEFGFLEAKQGHASPSSMATLPEP